jgi:hypothetical protein
MYPSRSYIRVADVPPEVIQEIKRLYPNVGFSQYGTVFHDADTHAAKYRTVEPLEETPAGQTHYGFVDPVTFVPEPALPATHQWLVYHIFRMMGDDLISVSISGSMVRKIFGVNPSDKCW